jgi:uncharacterized SAM-binding protein YcdF (DUF218 family)
MRLLRFLAMFLLAFLAAAVLSGPFLVVDEPQKSDVILVLAGGNDLRPQRAFELLEEGFATHLLLDVPDGEPIYGVSELDLAKQWLASRSHGQEMQVCPTKGRSTKSEANDVANCLAGRGLRNVLIVTSDFHTRRALNTFRRQLPRYRFSIAASKDDREFGLPWWRHRQWAKTYFDEWLRLLWWSVVERWH